MREYPLFGISKAGKVLEELYDELKAKDRKEARKVKLYYDRYCELIHNLFLQHNIKSKRILQYLLQLTIKDTCYRIDLSPLPKKVKNYLVNVIKGIYLDHYHWVKQASYRIKDFNDKRSRYVNENRPRRQIKRFRIDGK